MDRTVYTE